jgi:AraC-like DNA-binding protein
MTDMVQAQSLRGYRELVRDLGGNPTRLLRKAGIDPAALDQLTAFVSFETVADLLEQSSRELNSPDFGLLLAERQDIGILDHLAVAMRYSDTVGDAMHSASKYLDVYNAAVSFTIGTGEHRDQVRLVFKLSPGHHLRWAQMAEHGIGLSCRILIQLSEGHCHLQGVWFPHPPVASEAIYRTRFHAPLTFRSGQAALAIARQDLDLPISENFTELHDLATRYLESQLPRGRTAFTVQVRQTIEPLLGTATCNQRDVARALYMHPRTMYRRLQAERTTFEEIKDEARRDLAQRYLAQPELPLSQITALLGYSEQSAFGRSCRRWFSTTPRDTRARLCSASNVTTSA